MSTHYTGNSWYRESPSDDGKSHIIAVNAVIVLIVGLLAFAIVKTQLSLATGSPDQLKKSAQQDAVDVAAKLQLDGFRAERWLATKGADPATRAAIGKATPDARADAPRPAQRRRARPRTIRWPSFPDGR